MAKSSSDGYALGGQSGRGAPHPDGYKEHRDAEPRHAGRHHPHEGHSVNGRGGNTHK